MWEQIRSNRRRTVFVVTMMGVLLIATGMALGMVFGGSMDAAIMTGMVGFGLWLVLWIVSATKGDSVMLSLAGAREVRKQDHPQLYNVVEEMAIAAQMPKLPKVFIVDDPSPNAFATGQRPEHAGVTVTTGLLRILDRDELQGVVAHEIGHIKNRDVALMGTAGVMVGAIVIIAELGLRAMWYSGGHRRRSRTSDDQGGGQAVAMIVAMLLLVLAPLLAQLLYFALSRKREYLADASGARYTRYPEGLARALEKIGGSPIPQNDKSRVTAPMYIVRPLQHEGRRSLKSAFATHPPIEERVRILRAMGTSADFRAYDEAFVRVRGKHVIGEKTLAESRSVAAREALMTGKAEPAAPRETPQSRYRQASNAFISASGYQRVECGECGAVLKLPPSAVGQVKHCLRCRAPLGG